MEINWFRAALYELYQCSGKTICGCRINSLNFHVVCIYADNVPGFSSLNLI